MYPCYSNQAPVDRIRHQALGKSCDGEPHQKMETNDGVFRTKVQSTGNIVTLSSSGTPRTENSAYAAPRPKHLRRPMTHMGSH